ncbi:tetratricopeptide repeat protein [Azospirillum halopraeferens]|uniref:O-linked N-acetylglucosamine transferase, SPINDLY family protein n=1 Tax=Azospirillum halopraeferens TaxID=34010 RepID=UPI000406F99E|nr:tetratricopeptide repeat protein [Azospirillum halopraeferens]
MTALADLLAAAESDRRAGRNEAAVAGFRRALALAPGHGGALDGLFAALDALGRPGTPEEAVARSNLGEALRRRGHPEAAEAAHRAALAWLPGFGGVWFNWGVFLQAHGRTAEAADAYAEAARLMPAFAPAHSNLGALRRALGRLAEAEAALRTAVRLAPDLAAARLNLGAVLKERGGAEAALRCFRTAVALGPDLAEAYANLSLTLKEVGEDPAALPGLVRALRLGLPDAGGVLSQLVQEHRHLCRWEGLAPLSERLTALVRDGATRQANPWIFLGEDAGPELEGRCAAAYTAWRTQGLHPLPPAAPRAAGDPVRIGYLSADFHEHATAVLIAELIERHDRTAVHVTGYSYGPDDGGPLRARLTRGFDRFVDLAALDHAAAADRIRADGVDILVDLKGHTRGARPEIAARRPAPVQAQWLGYPGTMGAGFIDYILADAVVAPAGHQPWYAERIVHLPGCYQPNDRMRPIAPDTPSRAGCGLPEAGFVFCCFNAAYKITPALFAVWMRLLAARPASVLWLLEGRPEAASNLRRAAAGSGVDPARLVFAPRAPLPQHLARHRLADLFLDTAPVGAHTTASDALWAGLPVLTLTGRSFAGRVGASLLHAVGLPELVTGSPAAYEAAALHLSADPAATAALRARLATARTSAPLFDTDRFARGLERAYATMWTRHTAGEPPRGFAVG